MWLFSFIKEIQKYNFKVLKYQYFFFVILWITFLIFKMIQSSWVVPYQTGYKTRPVLYKVVKKQMFSNKGKLIC